jgi:DNA repair protein RecO (recombination protein O)
MSQTFKTKGIVLKTTAFGDTSLIVSILTELFGIQQYIVKGARNVSKKQNAKTAFLQPGSILDLIVYRKPMHELNFIKEFKWNYVYKNIFNDVIRNAVTLYFLELLQKCLKQPDDNPAIFYFAEDILRTIDEADSKILPNLPVYVSIHLLSVLGLQIADDYSEENTILDLKEGNYVDHFPSHQQYAAEPISKNISSILKALHPEDLREISLNGSSRKDILDSIEIFYQVHISEFGKIKTLPILHEILN